jgi:hypothetical protein
MDAFAVAAALGDGAPELGLGDGEDGTVVGPFYDRLMAAIREIDANHIVFVDGNTYSTDFSIFAEPYENAIYACHDYARAGMAFGGPYPGDTQDVWVDRDAVEEKFLERTRWQPEFHPLAQMYYDRFRRARAVFVNQYGNNLLNGFQRFFQSGKLEIYARHGAGWSIWTYKDVGLQGLVHTAPDSAYMLRFADLIAKKARLGIDSWASTDAEIPGVVEPVHDLSATEFPTWRPYPWGARGTTDDIVRHLLFAQAMLPEYAERFRGLDDAELDALAGSFSLSHCVRRTRLCDLLASQMGAVA